MKNFNDYLEEVKKEEFNKDEELKKFEEKLKTHDWYYYMSDDHSVWKSGKDNQATINNMKEMLEKNGFGKEAQILIDKYKQRS